jgi:hypothetical protein
MHTPPVVHFLYDMFGAFNIKKLPFRYVFFVPGFHTPLMRILEGIIFYRVFPKNRVKGHPAKKGALFRGKTGGV